MAFTRFVRARGRLLPLLRSLLSCGTDLQTSDSYSFVSTSGWMCCEGEEVGQGGDVPVSGINGPWEPS